VTIQFNIGEINLPRMKENSIKARKATIVRMNELFDGAIRAFVYEAVSGSSGNQRIGVETGMAAASLLPFLKTYRVKQGNDLIGVLTAEIEARKVRDTRKGYTDIAGNYNTNDERSFSHGTEIGRTAGYVKRGTTGNPEWIFKYAINVGHWLLYNSETWKVLTRSGDAFEQYIISNASELLTDNIVNLLIPEYL